jgi:16S rRNA (guanine1207-N2)-methyltransferase
MKHGLSLPTQLLIRDVEIITGSNILIVGATEAEAVNAIKQQLKGAVATLFNFEFDLHRKLISDLSKTAAIHFGSWYSPETLHDSAVIYLPKSELLIHMVLSMVNTVMQPGGKVYIVGQKNAGIKSQAETIAKYIGPVEFSDAARHSAIYQAVMSKPKLSDNKLEKWTKEYTYKLNGQSLKIITLPGVFSYGKLDEGTRMLLKNLEIGENAKVLDWGCGSGIIGLIAQKMQPNSKVDMVDSNALALEATKMTLAANGLSTDNVWASDVFSDVAEKYDLILSNPPFHSGVETNYGMVEQFISQATPHLEPRGKLLIVANAFLRYRPLLEAAFGNCKIIAENNTYKVYEAINI